VVAARRTVVLSTRPPHRLASVSMKGASRPCQAKSGPMRHGMHLARRVGIPSQNQAMTVPHSASGAERLWEARRPGRRPELGRRTVRRSSTRPVAGASSSAESCCRLRRSRSSSPSRVIRSSATGDNGVSVDTQSAKRRSRQESFLCWLRRRRVDFDPPYGEATSDEVAGGGRRELPRRGRRSVIEKARAANSVRALTGEQR
jgi:hypothetical protein